MDAYSVDPQELRIQCAQPGSLNLWAALHLGGLFTHSFSPTHSAYWDLLLRAAQSGEKELRYALGLPRGFAKTTLIKLLVVWLIRHTNFQFAVIVSANVGLAVKVLADITDMLDCSNHQRLYGNWRAGMLKDTQDEKITKIGEKSCILVALGAEGSVRGLNIHNLRPDLIILEDAQSKESAYSKIMNPAFIDWMLGTLFMARSYARSFIIFIGNMYNKECALNVLKEDPDWVSFVAACLLEDGSSLWPEFRSAESLLQDYAGLVRKKKGHIFLTEMMNDPDSTDTTWFDPEAVPAYPHALDEPPVAAFLTIDPALGKDTSDNSTISVNYVLFGGHLVVREIIGGKWGDEQMFEEALNLCALHPQISLISIEGVAFQVLLAILFERTFAQRGISGIRVVPVRPRGISKTQRIKSFLDNWVAGTHHVHPEAAIGLIFRAQRYNPLKKDNQDDELDVAAYAPIALAEFGNLLTLHDSSSVYSAPPKPLPGVAQTNPF